MEHRNPPTAWTYAVVYGWLIGLTVLEVGVVLAGWPKGAVVSMLVAAAIAKATLIALYFMHLKFEPLVIWIAIAAVLFCLLAFFFGIYPDITAVELEVAPR
jgi:cytochrome c oxidase subunit 4